MGIKIIARNKLASFEHFLTERCEAGIELKGTEVKSLRLGKADITDAHVEIDANGEAWLLNMRIPPYTFGNVHNHQEIRPRRLLLNRREIKQIVKAMDLDGLSIVPTSLYFKDSFVKIEVALAKAKHLHDKRADTAKRDVERRLRRGDEDV